MSETEWFATMGGSVIGLLLGALIIEIRDRIAERHAKKVDSRQTQQ